MVPKLRTIDNIVVKFTVKTPPNIKGEPNHEAINEMMQQIYSNMVTPITPQSGGYHGHIGLITKPTLYTALSNTAWEDPAKPWIYRTVTANTIVAHNYKLHQKYNEALWIYNNDKALKNQVIDTVKDAYIKELKNKDTTFLGVTLRELPNHLIYWQGKEEKKMFINRRIWIVFPIRIGCFLPVRKIQRPLPPNHLTHHLSQRWYVDF